MAHVNESWHTWMCPVTHTQPKSYRVTHRKMLLFSCYKQKSILFLNYPQITVIVRVYPQKKVSVKTYPQKSGKGLGLTLYEIKPKWKHEFGNFPDKKDLISGINEWKRPNCPFSFNMSFLLRKTEDVTTISKLQSLTAVRIIECTLRVPNRTITLFLYEQS